MSFVIGASLALAVGGLATWVGFDRDRAFYPAVMIVIASYYVLFAVMSFAATDSASSLLTECAILVAFSLASIVGFKRTLWLVVAALASHALLDCVHPQLIANPGVPPWWPDFCLAYDLVAAGYLAALLVRDHVRYSRRRGHEGARTDPGLGRREPVDPERASG